MIISANVGAGAWMVTPRVAFSHCTDSIRSIRTAYIRKRASTDMMPADDEPDPPQFSVRPENAGRVGADDVEWQVTTSRPSVVPIRAIE